MTAQLDILAPIMDKHLGKWGATLDVLRSRLRSIAMVTGKPVSGDDANDYLDTHNIAVGKDRRWLGALFRDGRWRPMGYVKSRRVESNHGRPVQTWWPVD